MKKSKETKGRADSIDNMVSQQLRLRRIALGLSQKELAEAVGVSIQQIQKYEKATNRISSGKLYSFAKFLDVDVRYFFNQLDYNKELGNFFAEEAEEYNNNKHNMSNISEKEVLSLIKAFGSVKNPQVRKKIVELVKLLP